MEKVFTLNSIISKAFELCFNHSLAIMLFCLVFSNANAQDLEPRAYANVPKNMNVVSAAYLYLDGNVVTDPSVPIKDITIQSHNFAGAYVRTFALANKLARVQVVLPYVYMDGKAIQNNQEIDGYRSGIADTRIRFGINLLGSPALDRKDFKDYQQKTILGVSLVTSVPTGDYLEDKIINIGTNRWAFKPEVGASRRFERIYVESYAGVWFYTSNTEYLGTKNKHQEPALSFQFHSSYYFKNQMWCGVNLNWYQGGKSTIDDVNMDDTINNWRVGATFSAPIAKGQSLRFQFHVGANTTSELRYNAVSLSYQYSFF